MTSDPASQAKDGETLAGIKPRERAACSQLGLFHRFYEAMALGMHPTAPYLRRSRFAPTMNRRYSE